MSQKKILTKSYKEFELLSVNEIPDCDAVGIYLRHKKTGLDVFHLVNDDDENLFAFCFRTPVKNSTGAAHILEHSVFCGSEKFPLKEPFTNLMNQSVNTFLNALTYPDKTVYPGSSTVQKDYFNMMDVYGDAVFFPLLRKEAFSQEACRLEINDKNEFELQGVVYNEMKGCYSSFDSIATDIQIQSLFADTAYAEDSGGDPLVIPSFTYEDFKNFHKIYYKPNNCLLFLCGNIPTEVQLDFVQEHFLDRIKEFPESVNFSAVPNINPDFEKWVTVRDFENPIKISGVAPNVGVSGSTVTMNWICGKSDDLEALLECSFLCEVIGGHDGSPLVKALYDSELGDDLAPYSGLASDMKSFVVLFGLHGVQKKNINKVYDLIYSCLENLAKNGVSKNDIQAALMSIDFLNREILRSSGPYSLVLLNRVLRNWNYGSEPYKGLLYRNIFDLIRERVNSDPLYIQKLIQRFFLNNKNLSYVDVAPSDSYLKDRTKKEQELIKKLSNDVDIDSVKKELDFLHEYQNHRETPEETACMPSLLPSDIDSNIDLIRTEVSIIKNKDEDVTYVKNIENTNNIVYMEVLIPTDVLSPEDYLYLPFFSYCATNSGWNGKDWSTCSEESAITFGNLFSRLHCSERSSSEHALKVEESVANKNLFSRDWISFAGNFLTEKTEDCFKLMAEVINTYDFSDKKRIRKLLIETRNGMRSSIIPRGNRFTGIRSRIGLCHSKTVDELWYGLTQYFFIEKLYRTCPKKIIKRLNLIKEKLKKAGGIVHVVTNNESIETFEKYLPNFISEIDLKNLAPKKPVAESEFEKLTLLKNEKTIPNFEVFTTSSQVGYASSSMVASANSTKNSSAEIVLTHWLSGTYIWEKVRTTGGAYGASASINALSKICSFTTYRDPSPLKSVETFNEILKEAAEIKLSKEECDKLITGTYGEEYQPFAPSGKGRLGLLQLLSSVSNADSEQKIQNLLSITPEDVQLAAKRILENSKKSKVAILGDKSLKKTVQNKAKKTSVIINLPL